MKPSLSMACARMPLAVIHLHWHQCLATPTVETRTAQRCKD